MRRAGVVPGVTAACGFLIQIKAGGYRSNTMPAVYFISRLVKILFFSDPIIPGKRPRGGSFRLYFVT